MEAQLQPQSLSDIVAGRLPAIVAGLAICIAAYVLPKLIRFFRVHSIPVIGSELGNTEKRRQAYLRSARKLYNDGYRKFKNSVFRITTSRKSEVVVLSPIFLQELGKLPDTVLSMQAAVDEAMETKYTRIESSVPIVPHTVTRKLTPSLPRLNPVLDQEVREVLDLELPINDQWREFDIHHKLTRIVAMVSGRIFIGSELGRSEEYLDAAINYTLEVMGAQRAVQNLRPWQRPFLALRLPEVKRLYKRIEEADAFLSPLVEARKKASADPNYDTPNDLLQWLIDGQDKHTDANSQNIAKVQLGVSFAAIHTTTLAVTNAFYNIAAMPEMIPELREEIQEALSKNGGVFTTAALQSMKKLDSFLKETLRMNPATMASFQRKVLQPFKLSNGQLIPEGVVIEIPAVAVNSDPEIFENPDTFDPLRFYRMRQNAKTGTGKVDASALEQFVSVNPTSLTFGFGRHACPGRFFAANEIKMILGCTLLRSDMKMVDGSKGRYPNIEFAHMSIPDSSKKLLFKERST